MPDYIPQSRRSFRTRKEAEDWAAEVKERYKQGELGVSRIDINYKEKTREWEAVILLPIT